MIKKLKKLECQIYHYKESKLIFGPHENIRGDVTYITGDVSNITGNVSYITGNVSGIRGNMSGITGDIDECKISDKDRESGISIHDLVI